MIKNKQKLENELSQIKEFNNGVIKTYEMGVFDGKNLILNKLKTLIRNQGRSNLLTKSKIQELINGEENKDE